MIKKYSLVLISILLLVSCTEVKLGKRFSPAPKPSDKDALVYVYRSYSVADQGMTPYIYIDKRLYSALPHKGYTWFYIEPGKHTIEVRNGDEYASGLRAGADIKVGAGGIYYIKYKLTRDVTASEASGYMNSIVGIIMDEFMGYKDTPDELYPEKEKIAINYISNNYYVAPAEYKIKFAQ